jgi:hypothetical protein
MVCITLPVHDNCYVWVVSKRTESNSLLGIRDMLPYHMCGLMV